MPRIFLDTLSKFVLKKTVLTATNGNTNSQQTVTYFHRFHPVITMGNTNFRSRGTRGNQQVSARLRNILPTPLTHPFALAQGGTGRTGGTTRISDPGRVLHWELKCCVLYIIIYISVYMYIIYIYYT